MKTVTKWTGMVAILLALAVAGRAARLSGEASTPDQRFELIGRLAGPNPNDASVWLLEPRNDSTPANEADDRASAASLTASRDARRSIANRNRNPLNLKLGSDTRRYVDARLATISEIVPADGGRFLKFRSAETGFRAAVELLSTARYGELRIDRALRRWSNNGYGAEILEGTRLDADKRVPLLREDDLRVLLRAMAAAEGYKSPAIADEILRALEP